MFIKTEKPSLVGCPWISISTFCQGFTQLCISAGTAEERGMHVWRGCHSVMNVCRHGWGAQHARVAWVSLSYVCVQARLRSAACTCGVGVTQLCMCAGTAEERGMHVWRGCHSVMYVCKHGWRARHARVAWVSLSYVCVQARLRSAACTCGVGVTQLCMCAGTAEERGMHVWRGCHSVMYVCRHGWRARHARVAWVSLSYVCVQARLKSAASTCGVGVTQLCMCAGTAMQRGMHVWRECHSVMYVCRHGWGARHARVAWVSLSYVCLQARPRSAACTCGVGVT